MVRWRVPLFFLTILLIASLAYFLIRYAQGYQLNLSRKTFEPTGLLVATSIPDGAPILVDGQLASATNATLNLPPREYEIEIKKDGYFAWKKRLKIEKELVTKTDAWLFASLPDLKALTFTGATSPVVSPDRQKVAYLVAKSPNLLHNGVWVLDLVDLPLGISREPRQVLALAKKTELLAAQLFWSPNSKQILLTFNEQNFLLDTDRLNQSTALVDITLRLPLIKKQWQEELDLREKTKTSKLPPKLLSALVGKVADIQFAPDETKILYLATASAQLPEEILPPLPASSSQKEERNLEKDRLYVYDLKEDKNFFIAENPTRVVKKGSPTLPPTIIWFPTSKHIFVLQNEKISIMDYDGTNRVDVYTGPMAENFAFPFPSGDRILILTTLGKETPVNLYAISLR